MPKGIWKQADHELSAHFKSLTKTVAASVGVNCRSGSQGAGLERPLSCYQNFHWPSRRNQDADPGIGVTVDFWLDEGILRYNSDISAEGTVIRQGPYGVIDNAASPDDQVRAALAEIGAFIGGSAPVICQWFSQAAGG